MMEWVIRRAEKNDHELVYIMSEKCEAKPNLNKLFGTTANTQLGRTIETSYLSMAAYSASDNEMQCFVSFNDSPPECTELSSEKYIRFLTSCSGDSHNFKMENTVWLTYVATCLDEIPASNITQILQTLFTTYPHLDYAVLSVTEDYEGFGNTSLSSLTQLDKSNALSLDDDYAELEDASIYIACRASCSPYVQNLHIRQARVEDHDDLLPILEAQNESLALNFGDFYVAKMIENQNEHNVVLVAEVDDKAVGVMSLSDELQVRPLQDCFELGVYNNLNKAPVKELDPVEEQAKLDTLVKKAKTRLIPNIIISGPPAAGKGTQCEFLVNTFDIVHLSTGDMLRAAAAAQTEVGIQAKNFMDAGELVPDEVIINIIIERLQEHDCVSKGWLLDGFPRTGAQAVAMKDAGIIPDAVVVLDVEDSVVVGRISDRRLDPVTGKSYHLEFNPPPAEDTEVLDRLVQRDDDTEETVLVRLGNYHKHCAAVVDNFSDPESLSSSCVFRIDGSKEKMEIAAEIEESVLDQLDAKSCGVDSKLAAVKQEAEEEEARELLLNPVETEEAETNAFVISMFCLDERYISRSGDFLRQAFGTFPSKDYALLTLPPSATEPFLLNQFSIVPAKAIGTYSHVLYLVHRDLVTYQNDCQVQRYDSAIHEVSVRSLLQSIDCTEQVLQFVEDANNDSYIDLEDNPTSVAFVASIAGQVVGIVTCNRKSTSAHGLNQLKMRYDIEEFIDFSIHRPRNQATVTSMVLNPVFFYMSKHLLKEVMRQFEKSCLYYRQGESGGDNDVVESARIPCINDFIHANPRRVALMETPDAESSSAVTSDDNSEAKKKLIPNIIISGPPAAGKGTQCEFLVNTFDIVHLSTGDMLRAAAAAQTEVGIEAKKFMDAGELVPDEVIINIIIERLQENDCVSKGWLLDGFPRTGAQAVAMKDAGIIPDAVVVLDVEDAVVVGRISGRRLDPVTGKSYHLEFNPPPNDILDRLVQRDDDTEETVLVRLGNYHKHCAAVVENFSDSESDSSCVFRIDGSKSKMDIAAEIEESVLGQLDAKNCGLGANPDTAAARGDSGPFSLFLISKKLLLETKLTINKRIIVVGASDASIHCIRELLSVPYLYFTSITLISTHGLDYDEASSNFLPNSGTTQYFREELCKIALKSRVRVIKSKVVDLDRKGKTVVMPDGTFMCYDFLVLGTGLQDGSERTLGYLPEFNLESLYTPAAVPNGIFSLYDAATCTASAAAIDKIACASTEMSPVVVYGASINALSVVQTLLSRNIPGSKIIWVMPDTPDDLESVFPIHDAKVSRLISAELHNVGVTLQFNQKLKSVEVSSTNTLSSVTFSSQLEEFLTTIETHLMLCAESNDVDPDIFRAINESGLVYDGRLVVNQELRTTDESIYATGSLARFSRRYTNAIYHQYYNSRELGSYTARSLLKQVDPLSDSTAAATASLPNFVLPQSMTAVLPGGHNYVCVRLPGVCRIDNMQCLPTYVTTKGVKTWHDIAEDVLEASEKIIHYCAVYLDDTGKVCAFVYIGGEEIEVNNISCIVGLHESLLNSAVAMYEKREIADWIEFLRQGWAFGLYHDRFGEFYASLQAVLYNDEGIREIVKNIKDAAAENERDTTVAIRMAHEKVGRGGDLLLPSTKRVMEIHLLDFLSKNREVLSMYFLPNSK